MRDAGPAAARHPHSAAVYNVAVELTTAAVLLYEGIEGGEQLGHGAYSITWSARWRSDGGIVRPRALAVLRLMISSNLVGCSTGRSPDLAPLRIFATY